MRHSNPFIKSGFSFFLVLGFAVLGFFGSNRNSAEARQQSIATPTTTKGGTGSGAYITVTYLEGTNVRTGPSSFDYPAIGHISTGGMAPAIGRSKAGEWIQIVFPDAPRGTGWVYAANVSLSPDALLPLVEPPPTPTLIMTPTVNLTFVAAFQSLPTSTRLPTFTAPPSLVIPTFTNPGNASSGRNITTWVIIVLGLIGIVGMVLTFLRRR